MYYTPNSTNLARLAVVCTFIAAMVAGVSLYLLEVRDSQIAMLKNKLAKVESEQKATVDNNVDLIVEKAILDADLRLMSASYEHVMAEAESGFYSILCPLEIREYLRSKKSPLADSYLAIHRTGIGDLIVAISGKESTFGHRIPKGSYNAWGWDSGKARFKSWDDGIHTVASGLKNKYQLSNLDKTAKKYCPPNWLKWRIDVTYFMSEMRAARLR